MTRLAVFASGRGSNFHAMIDHVKLGVLENVQIGLLISNDATAPALSLAKENSIPNIFIEGILNRRFNSKQEREEARNIFDSKAAAALKENRIDIVALAGFMQVLGKPVLQEYKLRIMNIHPALDLVRFGGRGMYGERVHTAVLQAGETKSGCTIHYVDESVDGGPIILQSSVPVESEDTAATLAERVLIQEHRTYSKAIQLKADERIRIVNGKASIDWTGNWEAEWNRRQDAFIRHQLETLKQSTARIH